MALTPYHCYCCLSHRKGGMLGAIITLILSAISASYYIWVLLDLYTRSNEFTNQGYFNAVLVLHYFLIAGTGIIFPLLTLILFAGAYWYYSVPVAFFSIMASLGSILELGALVFFGVTFFSSSVTTASLGSEPLILGEILWFCIRFIYMLHLIFASWALYQKNSSGNEQKSTTF
ncbi:uncharacterized protein LOC593216 [Strongylocentrotus purpuratus]|uniref:Uncharacterized protein n=1 Tax=Strongylocentrotus purpuratus TaxID=7668 RepID=A0A7M7RI51_STRPU|nr:uncharacterized protein LOC593216 [Strongylocentrotus purpuratus]|eukprot:XP_800747.1 PREDICTED: uncharacterized protein LOC593216 [Strongylocentrotus purpuratus]